jgi:hypothetical protein
VEGILVTMQFDPIWLSGWDIQRATWRRSADHITKLAGGPLDLTRGMGGSDGFE